MMFIINEMAIFYKTRKEPGNSGGNNYKYDYLLTDVIFL